MYSDLDKPKKDALVLLGLDKNATIDEIELKMKEAIRNPKLSSREYNIIYRGAGVLGIDLSTELRKIEEEESLKELYEKKGKTIFTLLSDALGVSEEEVKTYSYEDIINVAERIVSTSNLSVRDYNVMLRGISTIERYLNVNKEDTDNDLTVIDANKAKK